jgi:hypothetical protein
MLVDFALEGERRRRLAPERAIYEACLQRFRPILMTNLASILGAVPLAIAHGPRIGAATPARDRHHWRADRFAVAHALYNPGDLSHAPPVAPNIRWIGKPCGL